MNKKSIQLQQLNQKMMRMAVLRKMPMPTHGWVKAIRGAIGMSMQQLGNRLSISKQAVLDLEKREQTGAITIKALKEVAQAMVLGALNHSKAQVALAVTGIAGPTGGSRTKPVGTVCFAWALPSDAGPTLGAETAWVKVETCHFEGDRAAVRQATHLHAIQRLLELWHQR